MPHADLDLALQGGGSHGAFTWGVLDRLLDEDDIDIHAVSGTSAGAVNAAALAGGLVEGGRRGAQRCLERVWRAVGTTGTWMSSPARALWADTPMESWVELGEQWRRLWLGPFASASDQVMRSWGAAMTSTVSPYESNPWGVHPLRRIIEREIDFEAVRACRDLDVYVSATAVRSGRLRVFRRSELSVDTVLASACLPTLFQAVAIDGEEYWDGGYAGNPSLLPLVDHSGAQDLLIVQINPTSRTDAPRSARDILDRMNEVTFNSALLKELRMLGLLQIVAPEAEQACRAHPFLARIRDLRAHRIDAGDDVAALGSASKTDANTSLITTLHEIGWNRADAWLATHRDDLGRRQTLDLASYAVM